MAEQRNYGVLNVRQAKRIAMQHVRELKLEHQFSFGLPEIDDRYHVWRVPILTGNGNMRAGEIVIDARTAQVNAAKSTSLRVLMRRLGPAANHAPKTVRRSGKRGAPPLESPSISNRVFLGDSASILQNMPGESVHLVFTSPPYYNARPDYTDYAGYEEYLNQLRSVIRGCARVLAEGRFFVINIAPVLLRRNDRTKASRRIAVPFDVHRLFVEEGFDFIDDIIWQKPEGAGWATSRGRRFAADRNPLQYKAVPVTEYILVYRKHTDKLIDVHIRELAGTKRLAQSKILGDYDRTNVWTITPASSRKHPAVFPLELAKRVIRYYSFVDDLILDPFGGIGTTGEAARSLGRRFTLIDNNPGYVQEMMSRLQHSP
ncbi:MAG TPA: site-specific DNA-methyltransferase [Candidatus Baltobacteraceae bacterium]|nr:site-specific DNA-methyltransferase [Candidatus Baltobacteraceae bacterium]